MVVALYSYTSFQLNHSVRKDGTRPCSEEQSLRVIGRRSTPGVVKHALSTYKYIDGRLLWMSGELDRLCEEEIYRARPSALDAGREGTCERVSSQTSDRQLGGYHRSSKSSRRRGSSSRAIVCEAPSLDRQ